MIELIALWLSFMALTGLARMTEWGFSDWLGYVTYFLGAIVLGIEGILSLTPKLKERIPPWLYSSRAMMIPMLFAVVSLISFLSPIIIDRFYAKLHDMSIQKSCDYSQLDGIRQVEGEFRVIATKRSDSLGSSTECVHRILDASKGDFEHISEIWIKDTDGQRTLFFLFPNGTWSTGIENVRCIPVWCENNNSADRVKHFRPIYGRDPPPGMRPPFGGTALYVDSNPEAAAKFGYQMSQCERASPIYVQNFDRGFLIGTFQIHPKDNEGQIYVIYNNSRWTVVPTVARVSVCGEGSF